MPVLWKRNAVGMKKQRRRNEKENLWGKEGREGAGGAHVLMEWLDRVTVH